MKHLVLVGPRPLGRPVGDVAPLHPRALGHLDDVVALRRAEHIRHDPSERRPVLAREHLEDPTRASPVPLQPEEVGRREGDVGGPGRGLEVLGGAHRGRPLLLIIIAPRRPRGWGRWQGPTGDGRGRHDVVLWERMERRRV